jgi:hypothetical protein
MKAIVAKSIIFCSLLIADKPALGQTWTQSIAPTNIYWSSIASSADGSKLVAVASSGNFVYTSTDSGTTWVQVTNPPIGSWMSVASSADGTKLAIAGFNSPICLSTNFGVSWSVTDSLRQGWFAIASSADGTKLLAVALIDSNGNPGLVFSSTNSGDAWTQTRLPNASWRSVASSSDGTKLMAVCNADTNGNPCPIFISTNSGVSWISNNMPVAIWKTVACSSDGTKLIAGDNGGMIYTSTNSGTAWISNSVANYISSVASSSDGSQFIAVELGGLIHVSTNSGAAWTSPDASFENWAAVASSADGKKLVAAAGPGYDDGIFISDSIPSPKLNVSSSFANLLISWIVPSTNMVLQQSRDLSTGNWTTLTNLPVLNFTNLHKQLTLSPTNSSGFFRLISE